jgi:hypothetical protein
MMSQTDIDDILASETASTQTPVPSETKADKSGKGKDSYQVIRNEVETLEAAPAKKVDFPKTAEIQRILQLQDLAVGLSLDDPEGKAEVAFISA